MTRNPPPKRYGLNDFNLGSEGELRRGSLATDDGVKVPFGFKSDGRTLGWIPSNVRRLVLAKNVRFALEWRCEPDYHAGGMTRLFDGLWAHTHTLEVPFGWRLRPEPGKDVYRLGPRWYFLPVDVTSLYSRCRDAVLLWASRVGAIEVDGEMRYRWWPAQRWSAE